MRATSQTFGASNLWDFWGDSLVGFDLSLTSGFVLDGAHPEFLSGDAAQDLSGAMTRVLASVPSDCLLRFYSVQTGTYSEELQAYLGRFQAGTFGRELAVEKAQQCYTATAPIRRELRAFVTTPGAKQGALQIPSWVGQAFDAERKGVRGTLQEQREILARLTQTFTSGLRGAAVAARPMEAARMHEEVWRLANPRRALLLRAPKLRANIPLRAQVFASGFYNSSDYFVRDGCLERVVSMRLAPSSTAPLRILALQNLPFRNIVCVTVKPMETAAAKKQLRGHFQNAVNWKAMGAWFRKKAKMDSGAPDHATDNHQGAADSLLQMLEGGDKLCRVAVQVWFHGADEKQLNRRTEELLAAMQDVGDMDGAVEEYRALHAFIGMLPGHHTWVGERYQLLAASNVADMLPIFGEPAGAPKPSYMMTTRSNALFGFHPFTPGLSAHNGAFLGPPGSGKSFAIRCMYAGFVSQGGRIVIITVGDDYDRFVELFGGEISDLDLANANLKLGPFLPPNMMHEPRLGVERMKQLTSVIELMATENGEKLGRDQKRVVAEACRRLYAGEGRTSTPDFAEWVQSLHNVGSENEDDRVPVKQVATAMRFWLEGPLAHVFNRNRPASNGRVTLWKLGAITDENTLNVMLGLIGIDIVRNVRLGRTAVVKDEVWKPLKTAAGRAMTAAEFRTLRKEGSAVLAAAQTVADFTMMTDSSDGEAMLNSFAIVGILKPKPRERKEIIKTFKLGDHAEEILASMPDAGGELLLALDSRPQVVRVQPTPLEYWMATSHPRDVAAETKARKLYPKRSRLAILRVLAERFPRGMEHAITA